MDKILLTKTVIDTFIQAIVVVNKYRVVFALPNGEKANRQDIKAKKEYWLSTSPFLKITYI